MNNSLVSSPDKFDRAADAVVVQKLLALNGPASVSRRQSPCGICRARSTCPVAWKASGNCTDFEHDGTSTIMSIIHVLGM